MCASKLSGRRMGSILEESFDKPRLIEPDPTYKAVYDTAYKKYRKFSAFAKECADIDD